MRKRWYVVLVLLILSLFFYISKTSEYFVSTTYNRDTFNQLQTIQNIWFSGILIGICLAGYKTKKVLIPIVCVVLFIYGCNYFNDGHYTGDVYILESAKVIAEEEGFYLVIPLEPEDGIEKRYRAVSLLDEPLSEDVYDWVDLEYHDSPRYGRQCYITQVSEQ